MKAEASAEVGKPVSHAVPDRHSDRKRDARRPATEATGSVRAGDRERRLIVSILSSFAARWVTPRIGGFIERHPEIDLEMEASNALVDFARQDVDAANCREPRPICRDTRCCARTTSYGARGSTRQALRAPPSRSAARCIGIRLICCRRRSTARGSRSYDARLR